MTAPLRHALLSLITRRYPFYSGCGTIANHRLLKALVPVSTDVVWAKTKGGQLRVPLSDRNGRSIYLFGDVDPKLSWILRQILRPGDLALDVGANLGLLTLHMAKLVGPTGAVHAFEPNPELGQFLGASLKKNAINNVTVHAVALGPSEGELPLHVPQGHYGAGSLVRKGAHTAATHSIRITTLDHVFSKGTASNLRFIKIDVEGFELEVLKGARATLRALRPFVLFESNETVRHERVTPTMSFLDELDYAFVSVPRCVTRMKTKVVNLGRPFEIFGHDIVAAPRGVAFDELKELLRAQP